MDTLFDFDALDEIMDGFDEKASASTSCSDGEVSHETAHVGANNYHQLTKVDQDSDASGFLDELHGADDYDDDFSRNADEGSDLSEIWPGEELHAIDDDDDDDEDYDAYDGHQVWEVVLKPRIVVRCEPDTAAEKVRFASTEELFFSDPHYSGGDWIKLSREPGYILKESEKFGKLIQPFQLDHRIPVTFHGAVSSRLRTMWASVRQHSKHPFLRASEVEQLRIGSDEALCSALSSDGFSFSMPIFHDRLCVIERAFIPPPPPPVPCPPLPIEYQVSWTFSEPLLSPSSIGEVTVDFFLSLLNDLRDRRLPCIEDLRQIVDMLMDIYAWEESLLRVDVPSGATLHVVGDLHGQFWDLCHIVDLFGAPSPNNFYLFNGDFVDRGQFSVEIVIALFTMKVAMPDCVHLNRGNHESMRMNSLYGFKGEVLQKYSFEVFELFNEAFKSIPLATLVNSSVLVVHGGLPREDGVLLEDIARIDRRRDLDEEASELMIDLLWSDPMAGAGRDCSPRGAGFLFGWDVTDQFCEENGLLCIIRSHEMKFEGFEWLHNEKCLTIFSAANYCDICGNFGAVCNITPHSDAPRISRSDLSIQRFEATPHPDEPRFT